MREVLAERGGFCRSVIRYRHVSPRGLGEASKDPEKPRGSNCFGREAARTFDKATFSDAHEAVPKGCQHLLDRLVAPKIHLISVPYSEESQTHLLQRSSAESGFKLRFFPYSLSHVTA